MCVFFSESFVGLGGKKQREPQPCLGGHESLTASCCINGEIEGLMEGVQEGLEFGPGAEAAHGGRAQGQ